MKLIQLDASAWITPMDSLLALLQQLGAPDWHGRNLNALYDSLLGGINKVEPPFRVLIAGTADLKPDLEIFLNEMTEIFADVRDQHEKDVALELI